MELDELSKPKTRAEQVHDIPLIEKIVAILGIITVIGVLSVIAYEAKIYHDKPPVIVIDKLRVYPLDQGFLVKIMATNRGSQATADLTVEGVIGSGEEKQTSTMTFDYVPAHSTREGGLFFDKNPEGVKLRAVGFQSP